MDVVYPPAYTVPRWSGVPGDVDPTGTSFLVIALGLGAATLATARQWAAEAAQFGPATLVTLESFDVGRNELAACLSATRTGVRIMVTGGQYDVLMTFAAARAAGAIGAELRGYVTDLTDLPVYCVHCRDTFKVSGAPSGQARCPGCDRELEIRPHLSAQRGSFLGSLAHPRTR